LHFVQAGSSDACGRLRKKNNTIGHLAASLITKFQILSIIARILT
jgi:hypothetical protein